MKDILKKSKQCCLTFMLGTCTTSPYWSLVCTTTVAGHPQRMSSLFKMRAVFCGSAYESGCSHLRRKPHTCVSNKRSSGLNNTVVCLSHKKMLTDLSKMVRSTTRWLPSETITLPGVLHWSSARTWWSPRGKSARWFGGAGAGFPPELPEWWGSETGPDPCPESLSETCTPESRRKERGLKSKKTNVCVVSEKITHLQRSLLENLKILLQLITWRFKGQKRIKVARESHYVSEKESFVCNIAACCPLFVYLSGEPDLSSSEQQRTHCQDMPTLSPAWWDPGKRSEVGCQRHTEENAPWAVQSWDFYFSNFPNDASQNRRDPQRND